MTAAEHLTYIDAQIESCHEATCDASLPHSERVDAQMGEIDWMVARQMLLEDIAVGRTTHFPCEIDGVAPTISLSMTTPTPVPAPAPAITPEVMAASQNPTHPKHHFSLGQVLATVLLGASDAFAVYSDRANLIPAVKDFASAFLAVWVPPQVAAPAAIPPVPAS